MELEQHGYHTIDWSLAGFRLVGLHRALAPGERFSAVMHDPTGNVSGDILAEVIWTDGDVVGCRFLALTPRLRLGLQAFAEI
ncbi:MAG: PilZ domain-containing protein [Alphaproteobacteria bacterium]